MLAPDVLKKELETFHRHKDQLVREAEGKFVVIHDDKIAGILGTYEGALRAGYEQFGLKPFLVKQIERLEQIHSVT